MKLLVPAIIAAMIVSSCWGYRSKPLKKVLGYKPIYSTDTNLLRVSFDSARPVKNAGKIYAIGNYVLQNDIGYGIHVFDRSALPDLKSVGFLTIRGNSEFSIKDGYLYANSFQNLLVINISDWKKPTQISKIKYAFEQGAQLSATLFIPPPEHKVYYDCSGLDYTDKIQTGWVKDSVFANCYYN